MDWLNDNQWAAWLALAMTLGVVELVSLDLIFLMLAIGAIAGVVPAALGAPFVVSALVAVGASAASLLLLRPSLIKRMHAGPELTMSHSRLVGHEGRALSRISGTEIGQVSLAGETWSAAPYDSTLVIEAGAPVEVLEIRGATAYVHPLPQLDP